MFFSRSGWYSLSIQDDFILLFLVIWIYIGRNYFCLSLFVFLVVLFIYSFFLFSFLYFHVHDGMIRRAWVPVFFYMSFISVCIISKSSWCPVLRCFVQNKLSKLDGSSCFSFISRGGWYSLMRSRRFHSRFFSDFE